MAQQLLPENILEQDDSLQRLLQQKGAGGKKRRGFLDQTSDALDQNQLQQVDSAPLDSMEAAGAMDAAQGTDVASNMLDLPQAPQGGGAAPAANMLAANTRQAPLGQAFQMGGSSQPRQCELDGTCGEQATTTTATTTGDGTLPQEELQNQISQLLAQRDAFVKSPEGNINPEQYQDQFDTATAMLEAAATTPSAVQAGKMIAASREILGSVYAMRDQDRADLAARLATEAMNQGTVAGRVEILMDIKSQIASGEGKFAAMSVGDYVEMAVPYKLQNMTAAAGENASVEVPPELTMQARLDAEREYASAKNISALLSHETVRRGFDAMQEQLGESAVKELNDGLRAALVSNITSTIAGTLRDTDDDGVIDETFDEVYFSRIEPGLTKGFAATLAARQEKEGNFTVRLPLLDKETGEPLADESGALRSTEVKITPDTDDQFLAGLAKVKSASMLGSLKGEVRRQLDNRESYSPPDPKAQVKIGKSEGNVDSNQTLDEPPEA